MDDVWQFSTADKLRKIRNKIKFRLEKCLELGDRYTDFFKINFVHKIGIYLKLFHFLGTRKIHTVKADSIGGSRVRLNTVPTTKPLHCNASTVFYKRNKRVVDSDFNLNMDYCLYHPCLGTNLAWGWFSSKKSHKMHKNKIHNPKSRTPWAKLAYSVIDRERYKNRNKPCTMGTQLFLQIKKY